MPASKKSPRKKTAERKIRVFTWGLFIIPLCLILAVGYFIFQGWRDGKEEISSISPEPGLEDSVKPEPGAIPDEPIPGEPGIGEYKLFFGNEDFNSALADCDDVFPVYREQEEDGDIVEEAINSLLEGPSRIELRQKYYTSLNPGVKLLDLKNEGGIIYADFSRELERNVAGSCETNAIRSQINETLLQFEGIERVVILVEGRTEDVLQP